MSPDRFMEITILIAGLIGTWAVMKYKSDSHSRQIEKIWDWKDKHEDEAGKERLVLHQNISKLEGGWEATNTAFVHFGNQLQMISENLKVMQQDLADLKAEKRARDL